MLPGLPDHQHPPANQTQTEAEGAAVAGELAALTQANLEGLHGCIDSPHDTPQPCVSCR
jgi:hypothetical protein